MALAPTNDGSWLHWETCGDPGGEPVLMIMGLSGPSQAWRRMTPHLSAAHRLILFDNRGTGQSDRVRGPLSVERMAADALAVLDAAGVESAHVVGVSMGGMIAQQMALDARHRVRSLSLLCTSGGRRRSGRPPHWRLLVSTLVRPFAGPDRSFTLMAPIVYGERARRETPDRVAEDVEMRRLSATPPATTWAQLAGIARFDVRGRLGELAGLPVLVVHGEQDRLVPFARGREIAALVPGARFVPLADTGHTVVTEAEALVAREILDHLERATSRRLRAPASSV